MTVPCVTLPPADLVTLAVNTTTAPEDTDETALPLVFVTVSDAEVAVCAHSEPAMPKSNNRASKAGRMKEAGLAGRKAKGTRRREDLLTTQATEYIRGTSIGESNRETIGNLYERRALQCLLGGGGGLQMGADRIPADP